MGDDAARVPFELRISAGDAQCGGAVWSDGPFATVTIDNCSLRHTINTRTRGGRSGTTRRGPCRGSCLTRTWYIGSTTGSTPFGYSSEHCTTRSYSQGPRDSLGACPTQTYAQISGRPHSADQAGLRERRLAQQLFHALRSGDGGYAAGQSGADELEAVRLVN